MVIEKYGLSADSGRELGVGFVEQVGCIDRIDIVKNGAIGLVTVIKLPVVAIGKFCAVAVMVRPQVDDAEAWIESTLLRWRKVTDRSRRIFGRFKNASANSNVGLLGTGESGKLKKRKRRQD